MPKSRIIPFLSIRARQSLEGTARRAPTEAAWIANVSHDVAGTPLIRCITVSWCAANGCLIDAAKHLPEGRRDLLPIDLGMC